MSEENKHMVPVFIIYADRTAKANLSRRAVIFVLENNNDITDGAEFWDGEDFLAFGDKANWKNNVFYVETSVNKPNGISATMATGKSIFWKETKERLYND